MDCCDNPMAMGRVFCPKPRRVVPPNTNKAVLPLRFHIRNDVIAFDSKPGVEFLEFIIREVKVDYASVDGVSPRSHCDSLSSIAILPLVVVLRSSAAGAANKELIMDNPDGFEEEPCATVSSSPPFFIGSPPCRIGNPLVQDAHFRVEKLTTTVSSPSDSDLVPSAHSRVKLENKQAALRVEGFDSPSSGVVALV